MQKEDPHPQRERRQADAEPVSQASRPCAHDRNRPVHSVHRSRRSTGPIRNTWSVRHLRRCGHALRRRPRHHARPLCPLRGSALPGETILGRDLARRRCRRRLRADASGRCDRPRHRRRQQQPRNRLSEGAMTFGRPSDSTDNAVQAHVVSARYRSMQKDPRKKIAPWISGLGKPVAGAGFEA